MEQIGLNRTGYVHKVLPGDTKGVQGTPTLPYRASSSLSHHLTGQKTQTFGQLLYAANSWNKERHIIA